jgi:murein DD-endopeptidase MepM/ murein hydrolase activator NlpD
MRHAFKAAVQTASAPPLASLRALVATLGVLVPRGVFVPLGVLVPIGALASAGVLAPDARALDSTGGTAAVPAATDVVGLGGAVGPVSQGTGGSEYGVLVPKPHVASKPSPHKSSHAARQTHATTKSKTPVKPKPRPKPKPAVPVPASPPAGAPTPAQTVAEGAVFPVLGAHSFGNAENRFGAAREGHIHEGQDVLASEGLQVVAPLGGTIITTAYQAGGAGWYAAEHTVDGLDFFYAHCQASSLSVSAGEVVTAGQAICKVGQTGDATGPHLHFEVWVGGWQAKGGYPIDPLVYLEAWEAAAG